MLKTESVAEFLARGGEIEKSPVEHKEITCLRCRRINPLFGGYQKCRRCTEAEIGPNRKKCRRCSTINHEQHFRGFYCKPCYGKRTAEYAKANPEMVRRANRDSYRRMTKDPVKYEQYLQAKRDYYAAKKAGAK